MSAGLSKLDQLDRVAAGALNHYGAVLTHRVGLLQERHAAGRQFGDQASRSVTLSAMRSIKCPRLIAAGVLPWFIFQNNDSFRRPQARHRDGVSAY